LARGEAIEPREGYRLHLVRGEHPASATEIRHAFTNGEQGHPWLDPQVSRWITEKQLYSPEE